MGVLSGLLRPEVKQHLLTADKEFIIDEVHRHWVTKVPGVALVLLGVAGACGMPFVGSGWGVLLLVALALAGAGFWKIHEQNMDVFVVTNMRVFRVHGVFNQKMATVPIARILDITVEKPFVGLMLNFGHFVFESAAQDQGLKRIEYVPNIARRDLLIQTVIQRAGLRARLGLEEADMVGIWDAADRHSGGSSRLGRALRRITYGPADQDEIDGV